MSDLSDAVENLASRVVEKKGWTQEEIAECQQLRASGMTHRAIGEILGRSESSVRHGLMTKGVSRIRSWRSWSDEEMQRLCELRAVGTSVERCAELLNRTYGSVETKISDIKQGRRLHNDQAQAPRRSRSPGAEG